MTQIPIPYLFLRGGTSRGPYFRREDLPHDRDTLANALTPGTVADGVGLVGTARLIARGEMLVPQTAMAAAHVESE